KILALAHPAICAELGHRCNRNSRINSGFDSLLFAMSRITKLDPRISIISLCVSDIQRSYDFYANRLGFPTSGKSEGGWVALPKVFAETVFFGV
ncbi:MAG: VOC family protein, partial [Akkermansiaceae bacterium]